MSKAFSWWRESQMDLVRVWEYGTPCGIIISIKDLNSVYEQLLIMGDNFKM